jgi:hypothetical protein
LRAVVLIALACASAVFLALRAQSPALPEPLSLAVACFLTGWIVLRESMEGLRGSGEEPSVLRPLAGAAAAVVVGAAAAALALLSRPPVAWLGILDGPLGHPTTYTLCALGGLFVHYALGRETLLHVGLAACAWLSVARSLATPDGPFLPVMPLLFLAAGIGSAWRGRRARRNAVS